MIDLLAFAAVSLMSQSQGQPPKPVADTAPTQWKLVWSDEFDGTKVDTTKWRLEDLSPLKNSEQQYYSPNNCIVSGGNLVILSERKARGDRPYTSGQVDTRTTFSQAFGRFEARMKLPKTKGLWPAFWLLPSDGRWPPEIDIMELLGHEPTTMYMTTHWGVLPAHEHAGEPFTGPDFSADFHVFSCEWFPDHIDYMVDGVKHHTATKGVPQDPMYIIINTAVGGDWPGFPDATTVLPQNTLVDYVRVYEPVETARKYLSIDPGRGRVATSPPAYVFKTGEKVKLTATAPLGWRLARWEGTGTTSTSPTLELTMSENRRVKAIFEVDPAGPKLLSLGKPATTSSSEKDDLGPANAFDASDFTRWSSQFTQPQWIAVDLEKVSHITAIRLNWEHAYAAKYTIEVSDDNKVWRLMHTQSEGKGGEEIIRFDTKARYVRMTGLERSGKYGFSLWDFGVYGDTPAK